MEWQSFLFFQHILIKGYRLVNERKLRERCHAAKMLTVSKRGRAVPTTWHVTGNLECIYKRNGWEELFNRMLEEEKIIKISFTFAIVEKSYLFLLMFLTPEATAYLTLLCCACSRPWKAGKQPSTNIVCLIKKLPSWVWWCMPLLPTPGMQDWVLSKLWLHCETLTETSEV